MKGKYLDPKADLTYRERVFYDDGYKKGQVAGREEGREEGLAEGHEKGLAEGEAKGRAEGEAKGRAEERLNNARSLKANGVPMDVIIKSLSLTKEETEQL